MSTPPKPKPRQARRRPGDTPAGGAPARARQGSAKKAVESRRPALLPAERSHGKDDRRRQILQAAVEVFAEKGYHGCRISDVADRAGVAYGLVYHYFGNKESLLAHIFKTNWSVFAKALEDIAEQDTTTQDKVRQIVQFLMNAFELNPLIVKVLVLEFGRSSRLGDTLDTPEVSRVFAAMQRILREGKEREEISPALDPRALTIIFLGALEAALASFVIPSTRDGTGAPEPASYEAMRDTLMSIVNRGFFQRPPQSAGSPKNNNAKGKATRSKRA